MIEQIRRQLLKVPALKTVLLVVVIILIFNQYPVPWSSFVGAIAGFVFAVMAYIFERYKFERYKLIAFLLWVSSLISVFSVRIMSNQPGEFSIAHYTDTGRDVLLRGYVATEPVKAQRGIRFVLECDSVYFTRHIGWPARHRVMVRLTDSIRSVPSYGDGLKLYGRLSRPPGERNPGEFDYGAYLRRQGVYGMMSIARPENIQHTGEWRGSLFYARMILPVRRAIQEAILQLHSPLSAAVLSALILGDRTEMPDEIYQAFANSGTVHVLALSGLHTGFILALLWGLFGFLRFPQRARIVLVIGVLIYYAAMTGFSPSISRAVIMISIVLIGEWLGRRRMVVNNLLIAAVWILFFDPDALFHVGFQLSFIAVISIVWIYPRLKLFAEKTNLLSEHHPALIRGAMMLLLVSVAAQIGTMPFTAYYFNRIPLLATIANVAVVPLAGVVMGLGFITVGTSFFSLTLAQYYATLNEWIIAALVALPELSLKLPMAYTEIYGLTLPLIPLYFALLSWVMLWRFRAIRITGLFIFLFLINLVIWNKVLFREKPLQIVFLDVGQGDCAIITTPGKKCILIDAGDQNEHFDYGENVIAPYLRRQGIERIHYLIMTHPHDDHIGGMPYLIRHFDVDTVYHNGRFLQSEILLQTVYEMRRRGLPHRALAEGDILETGDGVWMGVLFPPRHQPPSGQEVNPNHESLVIQMRYGATSFLWMGDAEKNHFGRFDKYAYLMQSDVIKVSHHGAANGTTGGLVRLVQPAYAVIPVGRFNRYHHPSEATIRLYKLAGSEIIRTDQNGAVIFQSNGQTLIRIR